MHKKFRMVVQLAKLAGLKVIASAGTDEKVEYVKNDLGADIVFNYKTTSTSEVLKEHGPIDIFWDNGKISWALLSVSFWTWVISVGGPALEAAIENCNLHARIIVSPFFVVWMGELKSV